MLKEYSIEGRVAIVTGAARGIGKGIALTLAEAGADIVTVDRTTEENEQTASEVQALGRRCLAITTDVTREDQVQQMVSQAISKLGKIDILVNNAGKGARRVVTPLAEHNIRPITDEDWYSVLDLNLRAILLYARAVGPHLIEQGREPCQGRLVPPVQLACGAVVPDRLLEIPLLLGDLAQGDVGGIAAAVEPEHTPVDLDGLLDVGFRALGHQFRGVGQHRPDIGPGPPPKDEPRRRQSHAHHQHDRKSDNQLPVQSPHFTRPSCALKVRTGHRRPAQHSWRGRLPPAPVRGSPSLAGGPLGLAMA